MIKNILRLWIALLLVVSFTGCEKKEVSEMSIEDIKNLKTKDLEEYTLGEQQEIAKRLIESAMKDGMELAKKERDENMLKIGQERIKTQNIQTVKINMASSGQIIFEKNGCNGCHSVDGSVLVGPSMKGLRANSSKYLADAMISPNKDIAHGYPSGIMPSYKDVLSKQEIKDIVEYINSL